MSPSTEPQIVRLRELTDLAAAIPHLIGFHPADSVVAVALRGSRERMSFTMRVDLPPPDADDVIGVELAKRMTYAEASAVLLAIYTPRGDDRSLPRRRLVERVEAALDVPLRDALLVDNGRVWSYLCDLPQCCPPEGRLLAADSPGATTLAAAHALAGDVVLPDRESLVATTRRITGIAAVSMHEAQARATSRVVADLVASRVPSASIAVIDALCARYAEPPVNLSHDDAADVVMRVHDLRVRDLLLKRAARGDTAAAMLIRDVARLAQPPDDAPAAAMLALTSYLRGDGVAAVAAAERALVTDADYSLAQLVLECVGRQLDPNEAKEVWARDYDDKADLS